MQKHQHYTAGIWAQQQASVAFFRVLDTPERGEPGYDEATEALRQMIGGHIVQLEFKGPRKRDNFGRLLCRVWVGDIDVAAEMLRSGWASIWRPNGRGR